eukprot:1279612-Rhodomonas_salina.2
MLCVRGQGFTADEYVEIRRMIISMVLSTDMSRHFVLTKEFKELAENFGVCVALLLPTCLPTDEVSTLTPRVPTCLLLTCLPTVPTFRMI